MTSGIEEQKQIDELKQLKSQMKWWRLGLVGTAVVIALASVATVDDAVKGLTKKGPRQEKFVSEMTSALKTEIAPRVQDMVKATFNDVKPEVQASFARVEAKMPKMAATALSELDKLQEDLPKRGEKVLDSTFKAMLAEKETKLKEMFPEATHEQIERLLSNLAASGQDVAKDAAKELFAKHHATLLHIHENLQKIHEIEKPHISGSNVSWELGLSFLDLFREDFRNMPHEQSGQMASTTESFTEAKKVSK